LAGVAGAATEGAAAGALAAGLAGAVAAGLAASFFSSFLAGSAAKAVADMANVAIRVAIVFILSFLGLFNTRIIPVYIYNAVARKLVDRAGIYFMLKL
jgi:predicted histidine transporter YuiF (NhaC family)